MNLVRGRKGNGRRGKKTMERGKGKRSRIMAYLIFPLIGLIDATKCLLQRPANYQVQMFIYNGK